MTKFKMDEQFLTVAYKCSLNPINFLRRVLSRYYYGMSYTYKQRGSSSLSIVWTLFIRNRMYCTLGSNISACLLL